MGSTATSINSGSSAYGQARDGARTQVERSVANQHAAAVPLTQSQYNRAGQSVPASGYQQNPSNLRQSSTNQVSANAGVQRGPYIPSVSTFVLLIWQIHGMTCTVYSRCNDFPNSLQSCSVSYCIKLCKYRKVVATEKKE